MSWFRDHYLSEAAQINDWRASPLMAGDLGKRFLTKMHGIKNQDVLALFQENFDQGRADVTAPADNQNAVLIDLLIRLQLAGPISRTQDQRGNARTAKQYG